MIKKKLSGSQQLKVNQCLLPVFSIFFIFGLIIISQKANAQTFEEWVRAVDAKTKSLNHVKVTAEIKAIENESGSEIYTTTMSLMRKDKKFHYRMGDVEIVNDGRHHITANHEFKTISLFTMDGGPSPLVPEIMSLDSILGYYSNPVKISENVNQVQFKVSQKNSLVKEVFISINKQQNQIEMLAYDYNIDQFHEGDYQNRVEIRFRTIALTDAENQYFNINRYIKTGSGKENVQLAERYKGYYLETIN